MREKDAQERDRRRVTRKKNFRDCQSPPLADSSLGTQEMRKVRKEEPIGETQRNTEEFT